MEHELRVVAELWAEPEGGRIVLAVLGELAYQPDQHAVQPAQNIKRELRARLVHGVASHQHCGCLLVEPGSEVPLAPLVAGICHGFGNGRDAHMGAAAGVLKLGHQLHIALPHHPVVVLLLLLLLLLLLCVGLRNDLEKKGQSGVGIHAAHAPGPRLAHSDLSLGNAGAGAVEVCDVAHTAGDLGQVQRGAGAGARGRE